MHKYSKSVTGETVVKLLNVDLSTQDRAIILLALDSGLRLGEIASLDTKSLQNSPLSLESSENKGYRSGRVAGKSGTRTFVISKRTSSVLSEQVESLDENANGPIFKTSGGGRLSTASMAKNLRHICEANNINDVTFHMLRSALNAKGAMGQHVQVNYYGFKGAATA